MLRVSIFTLLFLISTSFLSCQRRNPETSNDILIKKVKITSKDLKLDENGLSLAKVLLKTAHGNIVLKFYPRDAPNTVTRLIHLIQTGFYDGLQFHRVIPSFIIQSGDPTGTGTRGSGIKLKAEFNSRQHIKGTVAMARKADDEDSADSQFYIALTTLPHLDGNYTIFAQVVEGLTLLDKIRKDDKILTMSFEL